MPFTERQRIVFKTNLARDRAEILLGELLDTSRAVQIHNVVKSRPSMNCSGGLDRAISSARSLIETLNGSLATAESDLLDAEMSLIDEFSLLEPISLEDADLDDLDDLLRAEQLVVDPLATAENSTAEVADDRSCGLMRVGGELCVR